MRRERSRPARGGTAPTLAQGTTSTWSHPKKVVPDPGPKRPRTQISVVVATTGISDARACSTASWSPSFVFSSSSTDFSTWILPCVSGAPVFVATRALREPTRTVAAWMVVASKASGLPYSPAVVVSTAMGTAPSFMFTGLRRLPGFTFSVTGTAQSTENVADRLLLVLTRSTTLAFSGTIEVVMVTVLAPDVAQVTENCLLTGHPRTADRQPVGVDGLARRGDGGPGGGGRRLGHVAVDGPVGPEVGDGGAHRHRHRLADDTQRVAGGGRRGDGEVGLHALGVVGMGGAELAHRGAEVDRGQVGARPLVVDEHRRHVAVEGGDDRPRAGAHDQALAPAGGLVEHPPRIPGVERTGGGHRRRR